MNFIDKFLSSKGYIKKEDAPISPPKPETIKKSGYSCEERLRQIVDLGESFSIVYDCGAFIGRWAQKVNQILPEAIMVLIEPNPQLHAEIVERTEPFKDQVRLIPSAVVPRMEQPS